MFKGIIEKYIDKLSLYDINDFAIKNNIYLNKGELETTYKIVKTKYKEFLSNPDNINLDMYKSYYQEENFNKIIILFNEYFKKYRAYL